MTSIPWHRLETHKNQHAARRKARIRDLVRLIHSAAELQTRARGIKVKRCRLQVYRGMKLFPLYSRHDQFFSLGSAGNYWR